MNIIFNFIFVKALDELLLHFVLWEFHKSDKIRDSFYVLSWIGKTLKYKKVAFHRVFEIRESNRLVKEVDK